MSDIARPAAILGVNIAVAAMTGGASLWVQAAVGIGANLAATGIMDILMPQKLDNSNAGPSASPKINFSDYGTPISYSVGRFRSNGFFLRYEPNRHWRAKEITESIKTGLFGSRTVVVGYEYSTSYELGWGGFIVDAIGQVWSAPDEENLRRVTGFTNITSNATNIQLNSSDIRGTMRLYRGTNTQVNNSGLYPEVVNYRGVAFSTFNNLFMGERPSIPTLQAEFVSLPRPRDANGNPIPGFQVRGSNDPNNHNYYAANPAAVMYVMITGLNEAKIPHSQVNTQSFVDGSKIFAERHIGISLKLESPSTLSDILEGIASTVDSFTKIGADGRIELVINWDFSSKYNNVRVINPDFYSDLEISRPSWSETPNEIHFEWVDAERGYESNVHIETASTAFDINRVPNTVKLNYNLFTDIQTVRRFASFAMYKTCYPTATFKFKLNAEEYEDITVGDTLLLRDDSIQNEHVYFPVSIEQIDRQNLDSNELDILGSEDTNFLITSGAFENVPNPIFYTPWFGGTDLTHVDIDRSAPMSIVVDKFDPVKVMLPNIFMTEGNAAGVLVIANRRNLAVTGAEILIARGAGSLERVQTARPFATHCKVLKDYNGPMVDREEYIEFELTNVNDNIDVFEVSSDSDHIVELINQDVNYVVINNEVMQVGDVEQIDVNVFRFKNILRGRFNTPVAPVSEDDDLFFIKSGIASSFIPYNANSGESLRIKAYPTVFGRVVPEADEKTLTYQLPTPFAPILKDINVSGNFVELKVRPRFFDRGNAISDVLVVQAPSEYPEITIECRNGNSLISTITPDQTIIPSDSSDHNTGVIDISFTKPSNCNNIRVFQNFPAVPRSQHLQVSV